MGIGVRNMVRKLPHEVSKLSQCPETVENNGKSLFGCLMVGQWTVSAVDKAYSLSFVLFVDNTASMSYASEKLA